MLSTQGHGAPSIGNRPDGRWLQLFQCTGWLKSRRLAPWLAALVIFGALGAIYARYLARPHEFFVGDLVSYYQPMRAYTAECLAAGSLPRWTSAIFAGTPQIADAQLAVFYPVTWIHLAVPFPLSELLALLFHLALGGLGMLWLVRRLGLGLAPGLMAALGYGGSGFFISHMVHPNFVHSAAWVPWLLGLLHGLVTRPASLGTRAREVAGVALLTALCLLAGGTQLSYLGLGLAAVLTLGWLVTGSAKGWKEHLAWGALAGAAVLVGILLSAVQLLPSAELASLSVRAEGVTLEVAQSYRMAARQGLALVVPFPYGLANETPVLWSQPFHESFGYFGVLAIPLALTALFARAGATGTGDKSRPPTPSEHTQAAGRILRLGFGRWLLGATAFLALLAAMGPEAPVNVHRFLFEHLPGFDRFRAPGRLLFVVLTCTLLLAAHGLGDILGEDPLRAAAARRLHFAFTLLVCGVALSVALFASGDRGGLPPATAALARRSALFAAAVALAAWILLGGGHRRRVPAAWVGAGVVALHLLDLVTVGRALVGAWRVPDGVDLARLAHRPPPQVGADPGQSNREHRVTFRPDSYFMLQNAGLLFGYDNLRSYSPVMLRRTYDLLHLADRGRFAPYGPLSADHNLIAVRGTSSPVIRLLGVRHLLSHDRPRGSPGQGVPLSWRVVTLPNAMPRAFVVHETLLAPLREDRERLFRTFDPGRVALVETCGAMLPRSQEAPAKGQPGAMGQAREMGRAYTPARVLTRDRCTGHARIRLEAPRDGLLVFTEGWHPGWQARVNGRQVAVHRVNHALVGVSIDGPGKKEVELWFRPRSLRVGAWISGLALLGVLALLLAPLFGRWRRMTRGA